MKYRDLACGMAFAAMAMMPGAAKADTETIDLCFMAL